MRRITVEPYRYGDADWDRDFLHWGFRDEETKLHEAESVLRLIDKGRPLRILDVACGIGIHAVYWAERGHEVTAIDISETFINEGRKRASDKAVNVNFMVKNIHDMDFHSAFDAVVWIRKSLYNEQYVRAIYKSLNSNGIFIHDTRNFKHRQTRPITEDWERWREEDGVFHLERHWNTDDGIHHDVSICIDTKADVISERISECEIGRRESDHSLLDEVGFSEIEIRTMQGDVFQGSDEVCWLWVVARKDAVPGT